MVSAQELKKFVEPLRKREVQRGVISHSSGVKEGGMLEGRHAKETADWEEMGV